jgi:putative ABC transport system permease protein
VAVIGREAAIQLFADRNPIGEPVKLNGLTYTIIGKIRQKFQDPSYSGRDELRLFVPYEAMRRDFPLTGPYDTPDSISVIIAAPYTWVADSLREEFDKGEHASVFGVFGQTMVEREIRRVLAPIKGFDPDDREALSLWNTAIESVMFSKMMQSMKNFFLGVSLITLVLGGIGVMNIMLIAVRERTREIGLRKALGATSRTIHRQFIVEGLALTLLSGAFGLAAGWGCASSSTSCRARSILGMIITPGTDCRLCPGRRRPTCGALSGVPRRGAAAGGIAALRGLTCGSIAKSSARPSARCWRIDSARRSPCLVSRGVL